MTCEYEWSTQSRTAHSADMAPGVALAVLTGGVVHGSVHGSTSFPPYGGQNIAPGLALAVLTGNANHGRQFSLLPDMI